MPNWCSNNIKIDGPAEAIKEIAEIMGENASLMALRPMPDILVGTRSPVPTGEFDADGRFAGYVADPDLEYWTEEVYAERKREHDEGKVKAEAAFAETGHGDWYTWCAQNWGVKWPMVANSFSYTPEHIWVCGETPWGPPVELLSYISQQWPVTVTVEYEEPGMNFCGVAVYKDGDEIGCSQSGCAEYPDDDGEGVDDAHDVWVENQAEVMSTHRAVAGLWGAQVGAAR